ncbi:hypothetical protein FJTKL_15362 [Diaporthe vaccinii]|uniref:F-box domain-containing protein n=1 Tax=Diaporthe vaccinii TaxID=105482 RepID=A0ABR4E5B6_9PEZI
MAARGMRLRSGRVLGLAPPPPPPPPPAPIPPGPLPPGIPALNTLIGLPQALRMTILQAVFQGQPRTNLEDFLRPRDLGSLCLVNRQMKVEATEAYFRVTPFEITVLTAMQDVLFLEGAVDWGQQQVAGPYLYTLQEYRRLVARAQLLWPSRASPSWGMATYFRMHRSAGELPWNTCRQWVKDAGPFMRDVDFIVVAPMRAWQPMVSFAREMQLRWDYPVQGLLSVRVLPGAGANVATTPVVPTFPAGPVPAGLLTPPAMVGARAWPYDPIEADNFDGHCQIADIEANRLRRSYLPAVPPPGAAGFTGFTLRDLRSIAKSFSEPSIYAIQD